MVPVIPYDEIIGGIRDTFGKISAKTHCYYEAFPALGIAILRMEADLTYTNATCHENLFWELPEGLCPDVPESHVESSMPTSNLLGWAPAQILTKNQQQLLETLEKEAEAVTTDNIYNIDNSLLVLRPSLCKIFERISKYFEHWDGSKLDDISGAVDLQVLHSLMGSVVQGMTVEKHHPFQLEFDRSAMYCDGSVSVSSPYRLTDKLNTGAVISGYRMMKEPIDNRHYWACYDFDEYKSVPESWILSRNMIYTYGSTGRLNETIYTTGRVRKQVLQNKCIQHTLFESKTKWNIHK